MNGVGVIALRYGSAQAADDAVPSRAAGKGLQRKRLFGSDIEVGL